MILACEKLHKHLNNGSSLSAQNDKKQGRHAALIIPS